MAGTPDIKVLVGVSTGGDTGDSKNRIIADLKKITNQINNSNDRPKIIIGVDTNATLKLFQSQLQRVANNVKVNLNNSNVKLNTNGISNQLQNVTKNTQSKINSILNAFNNGTFDSSLGITEKKIQEYSRLGLNISNVSKAYKQAEIDAAAFKQTMVGGTDAEKIEAYNQANNSVKKLNASMRELGTDKSVKTTFDDQKLSLQNLIVQMQNYEKANDKFKTNSALNTNYNDTLSKAKTALDNGDVAKVKELRLEFEKFQSQVNQANLTGQSYFTKLKSQVEKLGVYFSAATIMMATWTQLKNMVDTVIKLDSAVTNLQIATGYTKKETQELLETYSKLGQQLGATTTDVAEAADSWLRQGYSVAQSNELIKASLMLSKLGQIDSTESTTALTSALKGYKLEASEVIGVVDKLTAVDLESATSAGGIAKSMSETANSARIAGVSIDKLIGYLAAVKETTQDSDEAVGNFAKTMFARIGNIKQGILEDPESGETLSNVESVLNGVEIKLRDSNREFRNFGTVLDEVAGNWNGYSSVQQRAIAVAFSGYRVA